MGPLMGLLFLAHGCLLGPQYVPVYLLTVDIPHSHVTSIVVELIELVRAETKWCIVQECCVCVCVCVRNLFRTSPRARLHNSCCIKAADAVKMLCMYVHGLAKKRFPGCENFVLAVAYHFCLALPEKFSQPGNHSFAGPCTVRGASLCYKSPVECFKNAP